MAHDKRPEEPPFRAGFLIHDTSRLRRTVYDQKLRPLGITRSQWWLLANLSRSEETPLAQTELARLLDVGKVTLGGLVERLEKNGLVQRIADPADRRSKRVKMTAKGASLLHQVEVMGVALNREIMRGISAAEEMQLIETLSKMKRNLKDMDSLRKDS